jgi:hypothetical protein
MLQFMQKISWEDPMGLFDLFSPPPCQPADRDEVKKLYDELLQIGIKEDFLSEIPGGSYNQQCRHLRTRMIGRRLHELGGLELMHWVHDRIRRKGKIMAEHLEYAWDEVGTWKA